MRKRQWRDRERDNGETSKEKRKWRDRKREEKVERQRKGREYGETVTGKRHLRDREREEMERQIKGREKQRIKVGIKVLNCITQKGQRRSTVKEITLNRRVLHLAI